MKRLALNLSAVAALGLIFLWPSVQGFPGSDRPEVVFSHRKHVDSVGVDCEVCHQQAKESKSGQDDLLPKKEVCLVCHDGNECSKCHSNPSKPRAFERIIGYSPKFDHAVHLEKGISCDRCHVNVAKSDSAVTGHLPPMAACMHCHDGIQAPKECITCHENPRGRVPASHILPIWRKQHGDDARMDDGASCVMCHERNDCQECHQGDNLMIRTHPRGFEFKHALEIRAGRMECAACHDDRSFCIECHLERHVYPLSHQRSSWVNQQAGSGGMHAVKGRINIEECTFCHADEPGSDPVCAACHGQ